MVRASSVYDPSRTYELDIHDVEYLRDGGDVLQARIYQPKGPGPFPALLYLHGGAWSSNDRTTNPKLPQSVAASGVVVCSIDFRQGGEHPFPSSMIDINYATRWLKQHARDFNALPETVGGAGSSSGGHLIMLHAMRPRDPRYTVRTLAEAPDIDATLAYVMPCMGVLDPYARYLTAKQADNKQLVARHDDYFLSDEAQQEANPVRILERGEKVELPPALVLQGTADTATPKEMAERFAAMYRAAGGRLELYQPEGMPHSFWDWPDAEAQGAIDRIKSFIAEQVAAVVPAS